MKLEKVRIKNFRSIADLSITFDMNCKILVGINEAGKSNILRALCLLDSNVEIKPNDIRQSLPDEPYDDKAYVKFEFSLDSKEENQLIDDVRNEILTKDENSIILTKGSLSYSIKTFANRKKDVLHTIDIKENNRYFQHYSLYEQEKYALIDVKKVSENCPTDYLVKSGNSQVQLSKYKYVKSTDFDIPAEYLSDTKVDDINDLYGNIAKKIAKESIPDVIYWYYNEKHLLPSSIDKTSFMNDPNTCLPLKHMFNLAQIENIQEDITNSEKTKNGFRNLLKRVQDVATKHFKSVWKEYKGIEFELIPNGANIDISVKDFFNNYDFQQRSDGFKRFVTFLLMISTKERTKKLTNTLILVDEPEISLHPKGARSLRDELIKLSEDNYVLYSTHSIFMIDKDRIDRHYEVKKVQEKTTINQLSYSDYFEEEVVYNALGCSMFELIKEKNIVFEGWKDKKLFITAMSKLPNNHKNLKTKFKDIGLAHSKGVAAMHSTTVNMELAERKCIIISDNDEMAIKYKKEYEEEHYYGDWYKYTDIQSDCEAKTGEDFVKDTLIIKSIKTIMQKHSDIIDISTLNLIDSKGKIHAIQNWLKNFGYNKETSRPVIKEIKDEIFKKIKVSDIEEKYYEFLEKLAEIL